MDEQTIEKHRKFLEYCQCGFYKSAQKMVKSVDVNFIYKNPSFDNKGESPVYAAAGNHPEILEILVKHGANLNQIIEGRKHPFLELARWASRESLEIYVRNGVDINMVDDTGKSIIHLMSVAPYKSYKFLVDNGANIILQDKEGNTPLHLAYKSKDEQKVKKLLKYGARLDILDLMENIKNNEGLTPIECRPAKSDFQIVYEILRDNLNIEDYAEQLNGYTLLHYYAQRYNLENLLLRLDDNKKDINAVDRNGNTPLIYAIKNNECRVSKYLIENGANISIKNKYGNTPLHVACHMGNMHLVKLIFKYSIKNGLCIDVKTENNEGKTPADMTDQEEIKNLVSNWCPIKITII